MEYKLVQVDAFTQALFAGNSAAVVLLDEWLDDELLQLIARENNLSETVYVKPLAQDFAIRWFTPEIEVDLCGHATLAAAYVMFKDQVVSGQQLTFHSQSGELQVQHKGGILYLDFPARIPEAVSPQSELLNGSLFNYLGVNPENVLGIYQSRDTLVVLENESQVAALRPDFGGLATLDTFAVCVTAAGDNSDFVSRFFAPRAGINEDPVTGSAHCSLIPYWAKSLGKSVLTAKQISSRGGELSCEYHGERVLIGGCCREYMRGTFLTS